MATPIWNDKENRWTLRIKKNGKEKKFTSTKCGIAGKKEVLKKAREYEENGSNDRSKAKCSVVWDKFIQDVAMRRGEQSEAYKIYSNTARIHILPHIANKRMSSLMKEDYQNIINKARPHDGKREVLSKKYLTTIRMTINLFVKYGVENGYCEPFYGTLYIPAGHPTKEKNILQPNEVKKFFEPCKWHFHLALCFIVVTGLRPGEMLGLKYEDIGADSFTIKRSVNCARNITECKNKNAQRVIPLSPIVKGLIDRQRDNTKHLKSEWVFCSPVGGMGSQSTLKHHLTAICQEKGLEPLSPYELRHSFISLCKNSIPEPILKELVGHSVSMDTFGVYGHRVNDQLKQAAELIDLTFQDAKADGKN